MRKTDETGRKAGGLGNSAPGTERNPHRSLSRILYNIRDKNVQRA
nr:MAG TPA: hypothetical protein [Bacteriophage sp.]